MTTTNQKSAREIAEAIVQNIDIKGTWHFEDEQIRCDLDNYSTNEGIRDCTVGVCCIDDLESLARAYLELQNRYESVASKVSKVFEESSDVECCEYGHPDFLKALNNLKRMP